MGVENYHVIEIVGEGSFGKVYKGRRKYTSQIVAMKFIMKNGKSDKDLRNFRQEIEILEKLKHENIIEMLDSFETAEEFCVVSEFAQGELFQILEDDKCLTEAQVQAIAKQLVKALHYLHSNRIIHRDMKPQNILICSGSTVKLCDFGFARAMSTKTVVLHSVKGTPLYMAPELVREQPYNHSVDLWSLGVILYELFVGQPPFYTNSMYTLIRHIVKDPVKYPEQMSPEFKSFLKGLLNKVQQQRLSWPAILEHPFIKESSVDFEESPAVKISTGCQAAEKGKTSMMPLPVHSKTLTSENWQPLERLENNSCTVEGAKIIGQEVEALTLILEPIKIFSQGAQTSSRGALHNTIQSLRILSNLVAAEAVTSTSVDEIIFDLLGLTSSLMREKSNDLCDLIAKTLYIIRILIDGSGLSSDTSYFTQWVALVELHSQIVSSSEDSSGRVLYESNSCIAIMLNQVMLAVKEPDFSAPFNIIETPKQILVHAKTSNLVDCLCMSLKTAGTYHLGSDNFLIAASEGCRALWCLVDALENLSLKEKSRAFPLTSFRRHLLVQNNNTDCDRLPDIGTGSEKVVEAIAKAFLNFKPVRAVMRYCLHQCAEEVLLAAIQLLLRCCMHCGIIPCVLCGIPRSFPVEAVINGGGDDTLVSDIFSIISLCGSYLNEDSPTGEANDLKFKYTNLNGLALHSCLLLATIAQSFNSAGRNSACLILTTSSEKQQSRLLSLARLFSSSGAIASFDPHRASAMLAFASILSMESGTSVEPSVSDIAMPYIPCISALCDYLKMNHNDDLEISHTTTNYTLSPWHGLRDGCVGLLKTKLRWGGQLAIKQFCATGTPQFLLDLLWKNLVDSQAKDHLQDLMGLSPVGVVWAVSCLSHCLTCSAVIFRQMMLVNVHVKGISDLLSGSHLKLIRSWSGPGGGNNGVRDIINVTVEFLAFPFIAIENAFGFPSATASMNSGFLLNVSSPGANVHWEDEDITKAIKESMENLQTGVPIRILRCADVLGMEDTKRPVAFLGKMIKCEKLAVHLVGKGMLEAARMRRLLDSSCPKEVIRDMLVIVSDLARMHVDFYKYIKRANIVIRIKELLASDDPTFRAKACSAVGNMCRHSSYFYESLARHGIISLLIDRCTDSDKNTKKFACFAIGNAAFHNDSLYEELRSSIPRLTNLLLLPEEDITKLNAAGALGNLVRHSNLLCEDIVSHGAIQALLKVVSDCSKLAWNSPSADANNESPLKNALFALANMCADYSPSRNIICLSESYQEIVQFQKASDSTMAKYARIICSKDGGA